MSLSQVRQYFRNRITEVDSDLVEWDEAFNDANIPESLLPNRYHIAMSSISTSAPNDVFLEDAFQVDVKLFKKGFRSNGISAHDDLLDLADCLRQNCAQPLKLQLTNNLRGCEPNTILLEPIEDSNDNIIKITVGFNVRTFFKLTDFTLT